MTTLTNKLLDATGAPVVGAVVQAGLVGGGFLTDQSGEVVRSVSTTTDGAGSWSLTLTPTASIEGTSYYLVREDGRTYAVTIPSTGTVTLRAALIDPPLVGLPTLGLSKAVADTLYQPLGAAPGGALTQTQADALYDPLGAAAARLSQAQADARYDVLGAAAARLSQAQADARYDALGAAAAGVASSLQKASNLSDLASSATARTNLGARGSAERITAAEQHGYLAESLDPGLCNAVLGPTPGVLTVVRVYVPKAGTVSNVVLHVPTAGAGLTAGQNFAGLYDDAGNLLTGSADQAASWAVTGAKTIPLTTPQAVSADSYLRVVLLVNGTTAPQFRCSSTSTVTPNLGQTGSAIRFGSSGSGLTALPASINLAGLTGAGAYLLILT